jgi:hypothetical protein
MLQYNIPTINITYFSQKTAMLYIHNKSENLQQKD